MKERLRIEALSGYHDRGEFASGSEAPDRYFREQVSQDVQRRITTCFVAVGLKSDRVVGYYTLSSASVALADVAPDVAKKLAGYPVVPAASMGRLAVAESYRGQGIGGALLCDALMRVARTGLGVFAMLADVPDESAQLFYEHYGFRLLADGGRRMCLPIARGLRPSG